MPAVQPFDSTSFIFLVKLLSSYVVPSRNHPLHQSPLQLLFQPELAVVMGRRRLDRSQQLTVLAVRWGQALVLVEALVCHQELAGRGIDTGQPQPVFRLTGISQVGPFETADAGRAVAQMVLRNCYISTKLPKSRHDRPLLTGLFSMYLRRQALALAY